MAFVVLASAGAVVGAMGLEGAIDNVFGLPRSRMDVHERLTEFLSSDQGEQASYFEDNDDVEHKFVPKDPPLHNLSTVSRWLCSVRPMVGVTVRLYCGSGVDAFCDGGVTVNDLDNRGADGVYDELEQFCLNVVTTPNINDISLMLTVTSLDKDDRMEGRCAIFVARAVVNRLRALNPSIKLGSEIVVPRDCEDPGEIKPGCIMYKILPVKENSDIVIARDEVPQKGKQCNILVTGETGAGKSTFSNLLAECDPDAPLFPVKQNSTGSTVIRCVRKQQKGVCYSIYDTPGFEDASGADSVTACDLWNLTREISYVSCVAHVMAHSEQRRGTIDTSGLNKYLRMIGEAARKRLCIIITYNRGAVTRRTVQNAVSELMRRTGISRAEAESRVLTVELEAAREMAARSDATGLGKENWESAMRVLQFATEGEEETEHAMNMRIAFEMLAANPNGPTAEVTRRKIMREYYESWKARTARLGSVHGVEVEPSGEDGHEAAVRMGSGTRLTADKRVFTFALHFSHAETRDRFVKETFHTSDAVCEWLHGEKLAALPIGTESGESGFLVNYETFFYRVVHRDELQDVKWVREVIIKNGKKATNNVMWGRFEKLVKQYILVPPLNESE